MDWRKFRPIKKWLVVKADPRVKKTKGGIVLTEQLTHVEKMMEGTGHILKVGGEASSIYGLEPGMRICFRGFLKDAFTEFGKEYDCDVFLLRAEDAIAVIDEEITMGAFG